MIFIKKGKILKKVLIDDIVCIEVEKKHCKIITENEEFLIIISLTKIMEFLDSTKFSRIHRNFIVNTTKIIEIIPVDNLVVLTGNHTATLSVKYKGLMEQIRVLK